MAVTWPMTQNPAYGFQEEYTKAQIRSKFENGTVQSRAKETKGRHRWPALIWPVLPVADYETLKTFFETNQGSAFDWTHPQSSVVYPVRFIGDSLKATYISVPGHVRVEVGLEEA